MRGNIMYKSIIFLAASAIGLLFPIYCYAITVESLSTRLGSGEVMTIIDIRNNALYQKSHIQNAINIPATLIERKRLPGLGMVVVYGDGVDEEVTLQAVNQLNLKPGIQAELLEGGITSWSAKNAATIHQKGLEVRQTKNITYKKLLKMTVENNAIILVDLRMGKVQELFTDHFPNTQIFDAFSSNQDDISNVVASSLVLAGIPKDNQNILILIDDGNGFSEKIADKLHAAGSKRLAILIGGEKALQVRGITQTVKRIGD
jgi:rhodanese-related sulfurtransferase